MKKKRFLSVKVPFSGFYESSHSELFDNWIEREIEYLENECQAPPEEAAELSELFFQSMDWKGLYRRYAKAYTEAVQDLINDGSGLNPPLIMKFKELTSPKVYNYSTDCIYATMQAKDLQDLLGIVPRGKWVAYVEEQCTGRDGFISHFPADYAAWDQDITTWNEAQLGMILEAYLMYVLELDILGENALSPYTLMEYYQSNGHLDNDVWEFVGKEFTTAHDDLAARSINN
jgi:hypothetical protein